MDHFISAIPAILSLILIEGILSVDNMLMIGVMASKLPEKQAPKALLYGVWGAFLFRGLSLFLVNFITNFLALKIAAAAWLLWLPIKHFITTDDEKEVKQYPGFWTTVAMIEITDLSLSVDNVIAAVALDPRFWVVFTGVAMGIIFLRLGANQCRALIKKFPILNHTAFLLIGFVGLVLCFEISSPWWNNGTTIHISALYKFIGICAIVALSLMYEHISKRPVTPFQESPFKGPTED